jgi:deoxycytidylate deaminase
VTDPISPPAHLIDLAVEVSQWSPCRSKRGVVIFNHDDVVSHGHNYKPAGFECDGTETCKATCRNEAIHAEQDALLAASNRARGAAMLHVKTINGQLVTSGGPSCVQCSKLAVAAGIVAVWLFHDNGWRRYVAREFHQQSLVANKETA